jgi:DNA-binding transcriptional LysR family regulator
MVCLVDRDNPRLADGRLSLDDLRALPHALGRYGLGSPTLADRVLSELGVERRVVVRTSGWLSLPFALPGTDLVAVVPERLARLAARDGGPLVLVEPPFGHVPLLESYWFPAARLEQPAYRWLFARLDEVRDALAEPVST